MSILHSRENIYQKQKLKKIVSNFLVVVVGRVGGNLFSHRCSAP